jgi:lipoprotein-releasing system ATP-binding protein
MSDFVLQLKNIRKNFLQASHQLEIIKDANLFLKKSEMVALIGPSGSGKTTILQIAGLLDFASSGQVFIDDIDVTSANDKTRTEIRKNKIGFVYQFHHLLPEFSALENVALPLLIRGKNKKESFEIAKKTLLELELEERLDHKPYQLSGGQQQRVAIARAVVGNPSIILADEPTGNLDSVIAEKTFDLLKKIASTHQISCLIVTHNNDLATKCDRIITIKNGNC